MTHASHPGPAEPTTSPLPPTGKRPGASRWLLLVAVVATGVAGWQWYSAHRAEQTRRKLAATERMVGLEQARDVARVGGERLAAALAGGNVGEWQRLAVSVRSRESAPPNHDGPKPLFDEITAPVFADMERKLRAAAGALAAADADWQEVDRVLDSAANFLPQASRIEQRLATYLAAPTWAAAAAACADDAFAERFARSPLPHLARARAGLAASDDAAVAAALAALGWLYEPDRVGKWRELAVATNRETKRLAERLPREAFERSLRRLQDSADPAEPAAAGALDQPVPLVGDGPAAWLQNEAAVVEAQWVAMEPATDVARWERALATAEQIAKLLDQPAQHGEAVGRAFDGASAAAGVVPMTAWIRLRAAVRGFLECVWAVKPTEAEAQIGRIGEAAAECVRWLADVDKTKQLLARWEAVPSIHREQAAPTAFAAWVAARESTTIELEAWQTACDEFAKATVAAGENWLNGALVSLPPRLRIYDAAALEEWAEISLWFGADNRLVPLRTAAAAAAAAAKWRSAGLRPVESAGVDAATGMPKKVLHEATGAVLVLVPAGEFLMGSPEGEAQRSDDERQHRRVIRQAFYLGETEVTQAQWRKVMGSNPSRFTASDALPVETVSWNDCQEFVRKAGGGLRLPSEAEWEYACRAGTATPFSFGATITPQQVNYDGNYPYGGASKGLYGEKTVAAGSLPANAWGLHEMHGNVWEWCEDEYAAYPAIGTEAPAQSAGARVLRGGSWIYFASFCRAAFRSSRVPDYRHDGVGLRLARTLPQ